MEKIDSEFLDIINSAICQAVDKHLGKDSIEFFRTVGEYHFDEVLDRGLIAIKPGDEPLDSLIKIAKYLEKAGYMEKIIIKKLGKGEAFVEMHGVSVTKSSANMLREGKQPSHFMTNLMLAALKRLDIQAELRQVSFDEEEHHFKEHWKIMET